jgi:hypothetical protein
MKASGRFVFVALLFLSACAPAVSTVIATDVPSSPVPNDNFSSIDDSVTPTFLPDEPPPARAQSEFTTDFSKHSVPYSEILSGGPPKDGIPPLKDPQFVSVSEADTWLKPALAEACRTGDPGGGSGGSEGISNPDPYLA